MRIQEKRLARAHGRRDMDELSPERADQIRRRILEGAYDSLRVVDEVARRMLERGDL